MASSDMRGFRDALQPARRRREWLLESAQASMATAAARLQACRGELAMTRARAGEQGALAARAWKQRPDPACQSRLLAYLSDLQFECERLARQEDVLATELEKARQRVSECQQDVEVLLRHRSDAVAAYRLDQERRGAAEADQQWSMRASLREGAGS